MQNTPETDKLQEVINRYATDGKTGLVGEALKIASRLMDSFPGLKTSTETLAPTPGVIYQSRNRAGQTISTSNAGVAGAFVNMERTLQNGFAKASAPNATSEDKQNFMRIAQQVQEDAKVISAACFITHPKGEAKYEFVIEPQPGHHIPLGKAFATVQGKSRNDVEFTRIGNVTLMRPTQGFRKTGQKTPAG